MGTIQHLPYLSELLFQSPLINLMEYEEAHQQPEPSCVEEVLENGFETAFGSDQIEKPYSLDPGFSNDHFMERLAQMETELSAALGIGNIDGGNSDEPANQENEMPEGDDSLYDLLLIGAKAVEVSNWPLVSNVIARLTSSLSNQENEENPFKNMVFYFTQGLQFLCGNSPELFFQGLVPLQTLNFTTFCMLLEASPYIKFAQFSANQAILEATQGEDEVHVIDLDIMEGTQWPPLMVDLASRTGVSMKITAMVAEPKNAVFIGQTGRRLTQFADSIGLNFEFAYMLLEKEDDFNSIEFGDYTVVANCVIHQLHMPNKDFLLVKAFLNGVSRLSLKMVVLVEEELFNFSTIPSMSFSEFFSEAFQHYSALSDSLTRTFSSAGFGPIEREIMGVRILDCVRKFPMEMREKMLWEDGYSSLKGFKQIPLSPCNVSQAKLLVGLFGRSYWVQHENCRLSLCWNSRPLTTASVWVSTNM